MVKNLAENIYQIDKEGKVYKHLNYLNASSRKIVSMIPGDRKVAGCFIYSKRSIEETCKKY